MIIASYDYAITMCLVNFVVYGNLRIVWLARLAAVLLFMLLMIVNSRENTELLLLWLFEVVVGVMSLMGDKFIGGNCLRLMSWRSCSCLL